MVASDPSLPEWKIVLFATRGLRPFVANALIGMTRAGIDPADVEVVIPANASSELEPVIARFGARARSVEALVQTVLEDFPEHYSEFGSVPFNRLMCRRLPALRTLMTQCQRMLYADVDVSWLRNPLPYLTRVLDRYAWALSTEGVASFPPIFCMGFFAVRPCAATFALVDEHIARLVAEETRPEQTDQAILHQLISERPEYLSDVFPLPEALFPTGLLHRLLPGPLEKDPGMEGLVEPFVFHANWSIGLDHKRELLRRTGTWFAGCDDDRNDALSD